jgi:SAM-dependent methyltransferase
MIDRSLNYGRESIAGFLRSTTPLDSVLDIGAGEGADLLAARVCNPDAKLIAIESYKPAVEILEHNGIAAHALDIERDRLPAKDCSVDAVIANQILEHTKELFWILHESTRVLRVGGSLIIGVPNLASLHNRVLLALGRQPTAIKSDSAHVRGFTFTDINEFLQNCFPSGYECAGRRGENFYPLPGPLASVSARLLPSMAWGMSLKFVKQKPYRNEFLERLHMRGYETNFFRGPS